MTEDPNSSSGIHFTLSPLYDHYCECLWMWPQCMETPTCRPARALALPGESRVGRENREYFTNKKLFHLNLGISELIEKAALAWSWALITWAASCSGGNHEQIQLYLWYELTNFISNFFWSNLSMKIGLLILNKQLYIWKGSSSPISVQKEKGIKTI